MDIKLSGLLKSGFMLSGNFNVQLNTDYNALQPSDGAINSICEGLKGKRVRLTISEASEEEAV